jgi:hypothetical protein
MAGSSVLMEPPLVAPNHVWHERQTPVPVAVTKLAPYLTEFVESGSCQFIWTHDNPKLGMSLKCQKPRLCQRWNLRWVRQIDNEHCLPLPILFCEIDRLVASRIRVNFDPAVPSFTAALNG